MSREHLEGNYVFVSTAIWCYSTALFISMHDMKDNYIFYSIQQQFPHLETEAAQGRYLKFLIETEQLLSIRFNELQKQPANFACLLRASSSTWILSLRVEQHVLYFYTVSNRRFHRFVYEEQHYGPIPAPNRATSIKMSSTSTSRAQLNRTCAKLLHKTSQPKEWSSWKYPLSPL